jgi:hypothetical protein
MRRQYLLHTSAEAVEAYDKAWQITKPIAPAYFRGYGTVPGNSDTFLRQFQEAVPRS